MENLNTNTEYKPSYDTIKQQRDHFEERLKIEREKREAFENKLAQYRILSHYRRAGNSARFFYEVNYGRNN